MVSVIKSICLLLTVKEVKCMLYYRRTRQVIYCMCYFLHKLSTFKTHLVISYFSLLCLVIMWNNKSVTGNVFKTGKEFVWVQICYENKHLKA